jgi:hypothetical protein
MSAKCIGIYRPPFRVQSGGAIQFSPSPNRSAPQWSATRKVPLVDFWRKSWIDVAKSSSHHLSQSKIDPYSIAFAAQVPVFIGVEQRTNDSPGDG